MKYVILLHRHCFRFADVCKSSWCISTAIQTRLFSIF